MPEQLKQNEPKLDVVDAMLYGLYQMTNDIMRGVKTIDIEHEVIETKINKPKTISLKNNNND